MRRCANIAAVLLLVALCGAGPAAAAARNGLIAFEQFSRFPGAFSPGIHAIDPVTGSRRVIREARAQEWLTQPRWSPDGTRIAYVVNWAADNALQRDIEVAHADGTGAVRITHTHDAYAPVWSPDGSIVAFHTDHRRTSGEYSPFVEMARPDGAGRRAVTVGWLEHWRPDCSRILVQRDLFAVPDDDAPFAVGPRGRERPGPRPSFGEHAADVTWSPDGRRVAFTRYDGWGFPLFVADADGGGAKELRSDAHGPAWSPDGAQLVFTTRGHNLRTVSADGAHTRALTYLGPAFPARDPDWQPLPDRPLDQRSCRPWRRALWGRRLAG